MPVASMVGAGLALWACIGVFAGAAASPEAGYALAAPLAAVVGSWLITARTHAVDPARVTSAMVAGFGVKALSDCFR